MGPVAIAIPLGAATLGEIATATVVATGVAAVGATLANRKGSSGGNNVKCKICGAWHGGVYAANICHWCWKKGYR